MPLVMPGSRHMSSSLSIVATSAIFDSNGAKALTELTANRVTAAAPSPAAAYFARDFSDPPKAAFFFRARSTSLRYFLTSRVSFGIPAPLSVWRWRRSTSRYM